jgi:hypothetical protein
MEREIFVRLSEDGLTFIYSVRRGVELIESSAVGIAGASAAEPRMDEYYGGSSAMD